MLITYDQFICKILKYSNEMKMIEQLFIKCLHYLFERVNLLMHIIAHNYTLSFISNYEQKKNNAEFSFKAV